MTRKQRRLTMIGAAGATLAIALGLVLWAMSDTIVFFRAPAQVVAEGVEPGVRFRLGGLVEAGSVERHGDQITTFKVGDGGGIVAVRYQGLLPDLFREGQGVVAEGRLDPAGLFVADTVLARHDENYMPREVADALKENGLWQHDGPAVRPAAARDLPITTPTQ
ncbi:cytochrome c maturation protein CcmE [Salinarimonas sp.]|uniref:cytochrome c maturation protein CcmE n=1 Tax=Salinarimonas sp. TaxID=2766526 RepID=UPI0032D9ACB7